MNMTSIAWGWRRMVEYGWHGVANQLREILGPPIRALHQPVDTWLGSLPLEIGLACAIGLFVLAGIWVWMLPREFVFRGAADQRWWRDLRIWASLVLVPYIGVYLLLG